MRFSTTCSLILSKGNHFYILLLLLSNFIVLTVFATEITPNDAYIQADRVGTEIGILKRYFKITEEAKVEPIKAALTPRHTWQRVYGVFYRLNVLRRKLELPVMTIPILEPLKDIKPFIIYEQGLRLLTEIDLLKLHLGIEEKSALQQFSGKAPIDVFNLYAKISAELDLINGTAFTSSDTYSQALRVSDDINTVVDVLDIQDSTIPPPKKMGATPVDSFEAAMQVLNEINRIRLLVGLEIVDADVFRVSKNITPTEVFNLIAIVLAELQPIKFRLGLKHILTPSAKPYEGKTPSDTTQLLGWSLRKLKLIQSMNK